MADDDLAGGVVPVTYGPAPAAPARPDGRVERAAKLARRLAGLPAGRYEVIVTVGEAGVEDWSVRPFGKVER